MRGAAGLLHGEPVGTEWWDGSDGSECPQKGTSMVSGHRCAPWDSTPTCLPPTAANSVVSLALDCRARLLICPPEGW